MHRVLVGLIFMCGLYVSTLANPPHIIFILADDLGWGDVGFHGATDIRTPNIDALAYTGLILNRYYVSPICTPSRSALMTGKYPIHTGMQHGVIMGAEPWGLPLEEKILPEYLQKLGYQNHMVGKWHLGHYMRNYTPTYRGFKSHLGFWTGHQDYYDHTAVESPNWGMDMRRNLDPAWDLHGQYSTDIFSTESVKIIKNHNASQPLFLYLAHAAVHSGNPYNPLPAPDEKFLELDDIKDYKRRRFGAMLSKLDESVGNVVTALKEQNMLENSVIIFSTDNGGPAAGFNDNSASNYPLRGVKNTLWEGGVRGVGLLWSPKLLNPGRVYDGVMDITDWLPTILRLAGSDNASIPILIDGIDMWDSLNKGKLYRRSTVLHNIDNIEGVASVTDDNWKIVKGTTYDGKWDGWYEPSPTGPFGYRISDVVRSAASKAASSVGIPITETSIIELQNKATITCGEKNNTLAQCHPLKAPCLFYIPDDPCEYNNLAEIRPDMVKALMGILSNYNRTALKPRKVKPDPRANPANWDHTWINFGDYHSPQVEMI